MKLKYLNLFAILSLLLTCNELLAWDKLVWANRSSNMNDAASWNDIDGNVSTIAPSKDTLLIFSSKAAVQPVLTADLSAIGLYFVAHTNSTLPSVHSADGFGGYNYDGYNITAENGASLYLYGNQHNNGWTRDFYMASLGTNVIDAPIVFADNGSQHQAYCSGGRLILKQPLVATSNTKFLVGVNAKGRVVFESANPDFEPSELYIQGHLEIMNKEGLIAVPKFASGCWGWGTAVNGFPSEKCCRLRNSSGEIATITAETFVLDAHDNMLFNGDPFDMSNTSLQATMRDGKPIGAGETYVIFKEITCRASEDRTLSINGDGAIINLGQFCRNTSFTNNLQINSGTYFAVTPEGLSKNYNRLYLNVYPSNLKPANLGINFDYAPDPSMDNEDDFIMYHHNRPGGFAAYEGVRRVKLLNGEMLYRSKSHAILGGDDKESISQNLSFGSPYANGTIILENDINVNQNNSGMGFVVLDGSPFVDARIEGIITNSYNDAENLNASITKYNDGVLALDGPIYITRNSEVQGGGLLVNDKANCKFKVFENAWIGGTGTAKDLEVLTGGGIRPGEQGGEMKIAGNITLKDGAKFIIDVNSNGSVGTAKFTGSNVSLKAEGTIKLDVRAIGEITKAGRTKILDWNDATTKDTTAFNLDNYEIEFDEEVFSFIKLAAEDNAIYMTHYFNNKNPTLIFIR